MSKTRIALKKLQMMFYRNAMMAGALLCSSAMVLADEVGTSTNVFDQGKTVVSGIYKDVVGISSAVAVTAIVVALLASMFSHNQKTIDTLRSTAKGVAITWLVINGIGFIVAYVEPWVKGAPSPF